MRKLLLLAAFTLATSLLPAATLSAQKTGIIAGTVIDEAGKPVADVDVVASAENARARTDSLGRFEIRNLDGGSYGVRTRRIGYMPTRVTADISRGGRADIRIEIKVRPAILDSVVVTAKAGDTCPERSYSGFLCRKLSGGKGLYLTDDDIFDKNAREVGDIFKGVEGFRIEYVATPFGRLPSPTPTRASQCLNALVNGYPVASTNPMPRFADEMIAVEIYASPADVPKELQRYVWGRQGRQAQTYRDHVSSVSGERCSLVVYWTRYS